MLTVNIKIKNDDYKIWTTQGWIIEGKPYITILKERRNRAYVEDIEDFMNQLIEGLKKDDYITNLIKVSEYDKVTGKYKIIAQASYKYRVLHMSEVTITGKYK